MTAKDKKSWGTIVRKQGWLAVVFRSVKACVGSFKMPIPRVTVGSHWKGKWGKTGVLIANLGHSCRRKWVTGGGCFPTVILNSF